MKKNNANRNRTILYILIAIVVMLTIRTFNGDSDISKLSQDERKEYYIKTHKDLAVKTANKYGLYPSVILAQSALESNFGESKLSSEYNNYFGVKSNNPDEGVNLNTKEFIEGKETEVLESFKRYKSVEESFDSYGKLISQASRYRDVVSAKNYKEAAYNIQYAGYATDPNYGDKIISVIERYGLDELDR